MKYLSLLSLIVLAAACGQVSNQHKLPVFGNHDYQENDTIFYQTGEFNLLDQDSSQVTHDTFDGRIVVADFFFTSCPTICPTMKAQMMRVHDKIEDDKDVVITSFSIDPEYDSVGLLHNYAQNLGVKTPQWHFITGEKDSIYQLAETYLVLADEDPTAPGGFVHSGAFLLLDKARRIRGVYDGTMPNEVELLLNDIDLLRKEYE